MRSYLMNFGSSFVIDKAGVTVGYHGCKCDGRSPQFFIVDGNRDNASHVST